MKFLPFIPMGGNSANKFWRCAHDGVCDDTNGMLNFVPIRVMQKSPVQIYSISSMLNFENFILVERFHFRFERLLQWDFGKSRPRLEVYQIWEKSIQRNQSYEGMNFRQDR